MVEETSCRPRSVKIGQLMGRVALIAIGVPTASIMTIAAFHEIAASDFFGASVSLMVVVFGIQLLWIGIRGFSGATPGPRHPDPLEELWHSNKRVYLIRPSHAKLEIRGRP